MAYQSFHATHVRLVILRLTSEGSGVANDRLLRAGLDKWGLVVSLDTVAAAIGWLRERELLEVKELPGDPPVLRVAVTAAGREVAEGRRRVDGVAVPSRGVV